MTLAQGDEPMMSSTDRSPFVPILTVMVDYGNAPFLWLINNPDQGGIGGDCCDGTFWDESYLMSEGLWRKFADWAIAFDQTRFYSENFDDRDWDWRTFHARGLQLAHWLKEEVGEAYRVIYKKPGEDPNHRIDERCEILIDGTRVPLPLLGRHIPEPVRFCQHLVSGGQTGTDRGALDFAIQSGYTHGGWAPQGRAAEDGTIPLKYQLTALVEGGYRQRTRKNVEDSDGTLIVNAGGLEGGTLATLEFARQLGKPHFIVQVDAGVSADVIASVLAWLRKNAIQTLNVAGPRESQRPGIYHQTVALLEALDAAVRG